MKDLGDENLNESPQRRNLIVKKILLKVLLDSKEP
jgi:hypothetical protein